MAQNRHWEQDKDATIYMGNIDERATPAMMYEIMLQMGPIHNIHMPRDRVTQSHQGFGFVEFRAPSDAEYAANIMNGIKLFGKSLRVNKASADRQRGPGGPGAAADIGAELFVGNLDPAADERILYDTFSRFGPLLSLPKVARDDAGAGRGFGFISFGDFESADAAIENLNGQYLLSSQVTVQYAFKKDGKGERHGDDAERELAKQGKTRNVAPEALPLPPAFLGGPPSAAGTGAAPGAAAAAAPAGAPPASSSSSGVPTTPQLPAGFAPPPQNMPPGMHLGGGGGGPLPPHIPPPGFAPPSPQLHHHHQQQQQQQPGRGPPPYNAANQAAALPHPPPPPGRPAGATGLGPGSMPLPPAPSGLPARPPPQSQGGYTNPADYHPSSNSGVGGSGYRVPPGSAAAPVPPPPGFLGAAQPAAPPPGFLPPGFPAPPPPQQQQQPPPGYPRR